PRVDPETYFAMARGAGRVTSTKDVPAMEMTKWFDTNYHYIVPEFVQGQQFSLGSLKPVTEFLEAKSLGIHTRPVLLGPVSLLLLGKMEEPGLDPLPLLDGLLPIYEGVLRRLAEAGADWIQMDEPMLALETRDAAREAFSKTYKRLAQASACPRILVATYFAGLGENMETALRLPVAALHLDLVRAPEQLEQAIKIIPPDLMLSLGVVDGRNIWKTDLDRALILVDQAASVVGRDRILVAPSCSLLHSPADLLEETHLAGELKSWLAFAKQKLEEIVTVERALSKRRDAVKEFLAANKSAMLSRKESTRIH